MKVTRTITEELNLEITKATLLTVDEAENLPERLRVHEGGWWLQSCGCRSDYAAWIYPNGIVSRAGSYVCYYYDIRPVLVISNLESSGLKIGDTFEFSSKQFEIISNNKAFCLTDIGTYFFKQDSDVLNANNYEESDIKRFIDEWFEKSIKESYNKDENVTTDITNANDEKSDTKKYIDEYIDRKFEEIKEEIKEELDKFSKGMEKINQIPSFKDNYYNTDYMNIPPACRHCSNHPSNGGSGICHCILGKYSIH